MEISGKVVLRLALSPQACLGFRRARNFYCEAVLKELIVFQKFDSCEGFISKKLRRITFESLLEK